MVDNYPIQQDFHWESFRLSTISRPSPLESTFVINYEQSSTKMKELRLISRIHHNFFTTICFISILSIRIKKKVFLLYKVIWIINRYVLCSIECCYLFSRYLSQGNLWKETDTGTEMSINYFLRKFFTPTNKLNNKN